MKKVTVYLPKTIGKLLMWVSLLLTPSLLFAAGNENTNSGNSLFSNPFFLLLITMVIVFLIIIITLGTVLVNLSGYFARNQDKIAKVMALLFISSLMLLPSESFSQDLKKTLLPAAYNGVPAEIVYLLAITLFFEILVVFILVSTINRLLSRKEAVKERVVVVKKAPLFWRKFIAAEPEDPSEVKMTDHYYDGIRELDNGMPPWLKYMFIGTIIFAVFYLFNYHVWKTSPLQLAEYNNELADADAQMLAFQKKSANRVDETNVMLLTEATALSDGKQIFKTNCTPCHGQYGEGTVGPNLTDSYWIHGGNIKDLFKTIKYGVVEKGMKSWQAELSPSQMQLVASYIKSLAGTNPPNPKAKQGDFYSEGNASPVDSLSSKSDTLVAAKADSLNTALNK